MRKVLSAYLLLSGFTWLLIGCQEDTVAPLPAPSLATRGLPQSYQLSLTASVEADQVDGIVHYAVFPESVHEGKPTAQELMESAYRDALPMKGSTEQRFTVPASSNTKYFIYATLELDDQLSEVAGLQIETTQ